MTLDTPLPLTIDVRRLPMRDRHAKIFATFRALGGGDALELINDHEPKPLHHRFQADWPGTFAWDVLEAGPEVWRVRITQLASTHGTGSCCGACGGA